MSAVTVLHSSTTFTTLIYSHPEKKGKDDCFLKQKVTNKFQTKYIYLKKIFTISQETQELAQSLL